MLPSAGVSGNPALVHAQYHLGAVYQLIGRSDEAEQAYRAALKIDDTFAPAYIGLGKLYGDQQDVKAVIQAFERAIIYSPITCGKNTW